MTFLVNLMFYRLDKFTGPIFGEGVYMREPYIWDDNWLTYLGAYIWGGGEGLCMGDVLTGFYGTLFKSHCFNIYPKEKLQDH